MINSVEGGGAASPVPAIADIIRRTGAEMRVFALTRRDGKALPAMEAAGLEVAVRNGGTNDHWAAAAWMSDIIGTWRPTHIWTSLTRATLLGQAIGAWRSIPVVSWQHAAFLKPMNRRLLRATRRLSQLWIGDSDRVTELSADRLGINRDRLITWPIFRADPVAPRADAWRPGQPIRIGSLGRLHRVKGYDVLIEALGRLKTSRPFEVVVGGDGAQRSELEAKARSLGVTTIRFVGYTSDPRDFLRSLHLYAQPSRSEGFCIAAHEAMQAGLPVVASAVGELPNTIVDGQTGWVAASGDPASLCAALERALAEPQRLAAMGEAARAHVLDLYSVERFETIGRSIVERIRGF